MVLRTYLDKTNTIVSNSELNTGKNPVSELFYGIDGNGNWVYSRLLLHFNLKKLIDYYNDGMLGDLTKTKHTLKMINTGSFHDGLLNNKTDDGKNRTTSFSLVAYEIPNEWDEGVGYDYHSGPETVTSSLGSNWFNALTKVEWADRGVIDFMEEPVSECHFPDGNEDLVMDLTNYINNLIKLNKDKDGDELNDENYGLVIAFKDLETEPTTFSKEDFDLGLQYVGFFTNNTQTFYEPFVETKYSEYIRDDRRNFYLDKANKLYLYVNANGEPKNLDSLPTIAIFDDLGELIPGDYPVKLEKKGVYSAEVNLPLITNKRSVYYSDRWGDIFIDGMKLGDIQMGFEIQNGNNFYDIGMGIDRPEDYKVVISGIRHNESILRGDVRRIYTNAIIPYTVDQKVLLDGIRYRLYVKEGNIEHTVFGYESVERSYKDNYFILDTDSLLPNIYYLDIQLETNQEVKTTKEVIKFQIVE